MKRLLMRSLIVVALCTCLSVTALAESPGLSAVDDGTHVAEGKDRDGTTRMSRDAQVGPDDGMTGTRSMTRNEDGNVRTRNEGTYRARAANDGMDWSWLGILGLIGLAGLARGDNRNRNRA